MALTGFDILEKDGQTFKSIYEILLGIGKEWNNISDIQQAGLAESLFGKRNSNIGISILQNTKDLEKAYKTALTSEGSAQREEINKEKSIEYSKNKLDAALQELAATLVDSGLLKKGIDLLTELINGLEGFLNAFGDYKVLIEGAFVFLSALQFKPVIDGFKKIWEAAGDLADKQKQLADGTDDLKVAEETEKAAKAAETTATQANTAATTSETESTVANTVANNADAASEAIDAEANLKDAATEEINAKANLKDAATEGAGGVSNVVSGVAKTAAPAVTKTVAKGAASGGGTATGGGSVVAGTALSATGWFALIAAVVALISVAYEYSVQQERMNEAAQKYGEELKQIRESTSEYKDRVKELRAVIDDENSTAKESYDARVELYEIQHKMIEQYGEEAAGIDLINGKLEAQNDIFEKSKRSEYLKTVAKFNDETTGLFNWIDKAVLGKENMAEMIEKFEDYGPIEVSLGSDNGAVSMFEGTPQDGRVTITAGNAYETQAKLEEKALEARENGYNMVAENLEEAAAEVANFIDSNEELYKSYILYDEIYNSTDGYSYYQKLTSAYNEYQEALENGSEEAVEQTERAFYSMLSSEKLDGFSDSVVSYFRNDLYPELSGEIARWTFKIDFEADKDGLKKEVTQWLGRFENKEQLMSYNAGDGTELQDGAYKLLLNEAMVRGISLGEVADIGGLGTKISEDFDNLIKNAYLESLRSFDGKGKSGNALQNAYLENLNDVNNAYRKIKKVTANFSDDQKKTWNRINEGVTDVNEQLDNYYEYMLKIDKTLSNRGAIDALNGINDQFDVIDQIYADIKDGGTFDFAKLDSKNFEKLKDLGYDYEAFVNGVVANTKDLNGAQEFFDNVAGALVKSVIGTDELSSANKDLVQQYLELYGVSNAQTYVDEHLATQKEKNSLITKGLADLTAEEAIEYINTANASELTKRALFELYLEKIQLGEIKIDTAADIANLQNLAKTALGTAAAISDLAYAQQIQQKIDLNKTGKTQYIISDFDRNYLNNIKNKINSGTYFSDIDLGYTPVKYTGGDASNKSGSGSEPSEKEYDWIEQAINKVTRAQQKAEAVISSENVAYDNQLSIINDLIDADNEHLDLMKQLQSLYAQIWENDKQRLKQVFDPTLANSLIERIQNGDVTLEGWHTEFKTGKYGEISKDQQEAVDDAIKSYEKFAEQEQKVFKSEEKLFSDNLKFYKRQADVIENEISLLESLRSSIEATMSLREVSGSAITTEADYSSLIKNSQQQVVKLNEKLAVLNDELEFIEASGRAESDVWFDVNSQINSIKASIDSAKQAQAEWNENIKELPIRRLERYIQLLLNIKKQITNYQEEQDVLSIAATREQVQMLFGNAVDQIKKYNEIVEQYQKNLAGYKYGTDKFNETIDNIQSAKDSVSELIKEMQDYDTQLMNIPIDKLNLMVESIEKMKGALDGIQSDNDAAVSAVVTRLNKEIEDVNDAYQERIDALTEGTEEEKLQLEVEQKKLALEKLRNQRTQKVLKDGQWQWQEDIDAIQEANRELTDAVREKAIFDLESERDAITEALQDTADKWQELTETITNDISYIHAAETFGVENWQDLVLAGNDDEMYRAMYASYETIAKQIDSYDRQIDDYQKVSELMSLYIAEYNKGNLTYEEASERFAALAEAARDGFTSGEYLDAILDVYGKEDVVSALVESQKDAYGYYADFSQSIDDVRANVAIIAGFKETWDAVSENVKAISERLKIDAKEEAEAVKNTPAPAPAQTSSSSSTRSSSSSSGGNTITYKINGVKYTDPAQAAAAAIAAGITNLGPIGKYADGVAKGQVGTLTKDEKFKTIQGMSLQRLAPDEVPALLHVGEAVLNGDQQTMLLRNIGNALLGKVAGAINVGTYQNNFNFGDIQVTEAQNVTDIAAGIMNGGLSRAMNQQLYKRR